MHCVKRDARVPLAWALAGLSVAIAAGAAVLIHLNGSTIIGQYNGATIIAGTVIPTIGALLVARRPRNPIGWLYLFTGITQELGLLADQWARYGLLNHPGALPAGPFMSWLAGWIWAPGLGAVVTFSLLLFPDGRLPSRRWRPVAWLAGLSIAGIALPLIVLTWGLRGRNLLVNGPESVKGVRGALLAVSFLSTFVLLITGFACVASLWVRLRRAHGEEREQVKWLLYGGAVLVVGLFVDGLLGGGTIIALLVVPALPVAAAIAIFKYRLYDIEVVIGKTVVVGAMVVFITAVYAALVAGVGTLVGRRGSVALSAIAAALVAVAFQPALGRARRLANRLVYGKRATPYEVLSELAERMGETFSVEDILPRMATILAEATGAVRSAVWLRVGRELRPAAQWPRGESVLTPASVSGEDLPAGDLGFDVTLPVRHQGELLGAISVSKSAADPVTPAEEKLLEDLAAQAGLVLRNARLIEELRASRQRLVAAQDEERRRLERNIHDGAQQQLVALAVKLNLAGLMAEKDPAATKRTIDELKAEATDALENLRDLARGIYPPLLADKGLAVALDAQLRKAAVPVELVVNGLGRYPAEVEAAVYFCCLEALQNVAKYAEASSGRVMLGVDVGDLTFEVADDGRGFDAETTPLGSGLQNMADRLAALGGSVKVSSRSGAGTRVQGRIPVASSPSAGASITASSSA
jgi:signal transduction histidine kinase